MNRTNMNKVITLGNTKYIKRILFGKVILQKLEHQNKFTKHYVNNNRPWSTVTADGEAFVGDRIKFRDGYEAIINSIVQTVQTISDYGYIVILSDPYHKDKKQKIPLNGPTSWECNIVALANNHEENEEKNH